MENRNLIERRTSMIKTVSVSIIVSAVVSLVIFHSFFRYELKHNLAAVNTIGFSLYSDRVIYESMGKPKKGGPDNKGFNIALQECVDSIEKDLGVITFEYGAITSSAAMNITPSLQKCLIDKGYKYLQQVDVNE